MNSDIRTLTYLVILFLSLSCQIFLSAQNRSLVFNSLNRSHGLPNNTINDIAQDAMGFVWFGTNDGLVRYDSPSQMKIFKEGDIGLMNSNIKTIHASQDSTLWIGTDFGGLSKLNINTLAHENYNTTKPLPYKINHDVVTAVLVDSKGNTWIGSESGLNVLAPDGEQSFRFEGSEELRQEKAILSITEDDKGWIWLGTWEHGIHLYIPPEDIADNTIKFRKFRPSKISSSLSVWSITQDNLGGYWIATHGAGLFHMSIPNSINANSNQRDWNPTFTNFTITSLEANNVSSNIIYDVKVDHLNNLWIATVGGLNILRARYIDENINSAKQDIAFESHKSIPFNQTSIVGDILTTLYFDRNNIMWVGAYKGVSQFNQYSNQFNFNSIINEESTNRNLVNKVIQVNETEVLLATEFGGVLLYDIQARTVIRSKTAFIPKNYTGIFDICEADDGGYFLGVLNGVLYINLVRKAHEFFPVPDHMVSSYGAFEIKNIYKDTDGILWCGSEYGLFTLNKNEGREKMLMPFKPRELTNKSITQTFKDSKSNIWITTYNGLNKLIPTGDDYQIKQYKRNSEEEKDAIPQNQILSIGEYEGHIILGGRNGVFCLNIETDEFDNMDYQVDRHNIAALAISKKGVIWASTSDGILKCDLIKSEVNFFEESEGIGEVTMRPNNVTINQKGHIYFGGTNGFLKIDPESIIENDKPPEVYITDISIINSSGTKKMTGLDLQSIEVDADSYYLSIEFAGLNYYQMEKNQFKYKLDGFDEKWVVARAGQKAIYTNLAHGSYTFEVTAANNKGIWNPQPVRLDIDVNSYIWERGWFKLFSILLLGLILWSLFKLYTNRINARNKMLSNFNESLNSEIAEKKEAEAALIEREKSMKILLSKLDDANQDLVRSNKDLEQFAFIVSHDMKEPLRTIGSFATLLRRKYSGILDDKAQTYIDFISNGVDRLSALIHSLLEYSVAGNKDFEFQNTDINQIVNDKIQDLNQYILDKNATIVIENSLPTISCVKDQIGMVFHNIILNGIKFNTSERPTIKIRCTQKESYWEFSIQDNGIGIPKESQKQVLELFKRLHRKEEFEGTGIGLALTNRIINNHNGKLWIDSIENKGTTISFSLPQTQ